MKTIEQNNRMIAEFMGNKFMEVLDYDGYLFKHNSLIFNLSWDWLMPVGEKCVEVSLSYRNHPFIAEDVKTAAGSFDLDKLYQAVVQFIEWYNEQK
jgi:hypothetical protein